MNILVLEDKKPTRDWISEYLLRRLHVHAYRDPRSDQLEAYIHDPWNRPGDDSGVLSHILPSSWSSPGSDDFDIFAPDDDAIDDLAERGIDAVMSSLHAFGDGRDADIFVVDLALSRKQQDKLERNGGALISRIDGSGWYNPDDKKHDFSAPEFEDALDDLTGYQIIRNFSTPDRVLIGTTYFRNPLVRTHCLAKGAFSVVPKPLKPDELPPLARVGDPHPEADTISIDQLEQRTRITEETDPRIVEDTRLYPLSDYLLTITADVLKAVVHLGPLYVEKVVHASPNSPAGQITTDVFENMRRLRELRELRRVATA